MQRKYMHVPPSGPSGPDESINQLDTKFFPLTAEQIARGKAMHMSDDQIHAIQGRMLESTRLLNGLKSYSRVASYMTQIYSKMLGTPEERANNKAPELDELTRSELVEAIHTLIPDSLLDRGIAHIAMYFDTIDDWGIEKIRIILAMLHGWKTLGVGHPYFGKIPPKMDNPGLSRFYAVIKSYTFAFANKDIKKSLNKAHIKGEVTYFYFPTVDAAGHIKIGLAPIESGDLPRVFSSIGASHEISVEEDLAYLEEIFLHSTDPILTLQPRVKLLNIFIEKHRDFFEGRPEECPWQVGKDLIETWRKHAMKAQRERAKKKVKTLAGYVPAKSIDHESEAILPARKDAEVAPTLPQPSLLPGLSYRLSVGNIWDEPLSALVPNMSEEYSLWIGVETRGKDPYYLRYEHDESVDFSLPGAKTTYTFVFCEKTSLDTEPPKGKRYPQNKIDVTPRKGLNVGKDDTLNTDDGKEDEPSSNTAEDLQHQIPGRAQKILDTHHGGESGKAPGVTLDDSPTDICSYKLLEALDTLVVRRINKGSLSMSIADWEDFELEYTPSEKTYSKSRLPAGVDLSGLLEIVGEDLERRIEAYLALEKQEFVKRTLGKLTFAYIFLREKFAEIGDISKFDVGDSFSLSRIKDGSGAFTFTSRGNASYKKFFEGFRTQCLEEYGIYFEITEVGTSEVKISLSLKGEEKIAATITSLDPSLKREGTNGESGQVKKREYYEISDLSHLENEIREQMRETLIHVLTFLGTAGRILTQSGKIITPAGYVMERDGIIALYQRGFKSISESGPSREKDEGERAMELIRKMEEGTAIKSCAGVELVEISVPGSPKKEKVPIYDISTRKNGESKKLLLTGRDDIKLTYRDECLAFMSSGAGHANVYERIRVNTRLQKYLALRMAYAINPKLCYDEIKDPIPEFAARFLLAAWSKIPPAIQGEFLACFEKGNDGRITRAIRVEITPGVRVFMTLLESLEANGIKILHHSPSFLTLGKIREQKRLLDLSQGK